MLLPCSLQRREQPSTTSQPPSNLAQSSKSADNPVYTVQSNYPSEGANNKTEQRGGGREKAYLCCEPLIPLAGRQSRGVANGGGVANQRIEGAVGVDWGKQGTAASFWFARRLASRISCHPLPSTSLLSFPPPLLFQLVWILDARVLAGVGRKVARLPLFPALSFPVGAIYSLPA
jgi:hypothetical protein